MRKTKGPLFVIPAKAGIQWVGEALASLFKATEVAPTLIRDYCADTPHPTPSPSE